jgi:hypothetical protein
VTPVTRPYPESRAFAELLIDCEEDRGSAGRAGRDAARDRPQRLTSFVVEDGVSKVQQKRLPGVPRTHLASLWFRIPCREPEAVARFWGVILGSEPEDIEGKGSWFIGRTSAKRARPSTSIPRRRR